MNVVYMNKNLIPIDRKQLTKRLQSKKANRNDLINQPVITFSFNQLMRFEQTGMIPKEYSDQIESVLSNPNFKGKQVIRGQKYNGSLIYFGPSDFHDFKERCKKVNISVNELLMYEHVASTTLRKYRNDRHIPSDLFEKLNTRLSMIEKAYKVEEKVAEKVPEETKVEIETPGKVEVKAELKKVTYDFTKVIQNIKKVVHCNGEANLSLNNISERYDCDVETFVNSVFSLVSGENYVIFTTYSNGKPVFTLSEPM